MFEYISGEIAEKHIDYIVIDIHGVGNKISEDCF